MSSPLDGIGVVDTMIDIPEPGSKSCRFFSGLLRGDHSKDAEGLPVSYTFKDAPNAGGRPNEIRNLQ